MEAKKKISSLTSYWSPECDFTGVEIAAINNNEELFEILMHPKL